MAMDLQLKGTFYDSPHGMMNLCNRSTAFDIARLCSLSMKNQKFRQIVSAKFYKVQKNAGGTLPDGHTLRN
jgi:D-alanyl-D-alanine carboxypeptidase